MTAYFEGIEAKVLAQLTLAARHPDRPRKSPVKDPLERATASRRDGWSYRPGQKPPLPPIKSPLDGYAGPAPSSSSTNGVPPRSAADFPFRDDPQARVDHGSPGKRL